jgi:hypothetical protein
VNVRRVAAHISEAEMPPPVRTEKSEIRFAPSFVRGTSPDTGEVGHLYTASSLGRFLGMEKKSGQASERLRL